MFPLEIDDNSYPAATWRCKAITPKRKFPLELLRIARAAALDLRLDVQLDIYERAGKKSPRITQAKSQ